jgi:hypothetical protein
MNKYLYLFIFFSFFYFFKVYYVGYSINNDGILYIAIANEISQGNTDYIRENIYGNLAYPYLINYIKYFSGLSLLNSAIIINYFFSIAFLLTLIKFNNTFFKNKNLYFYLMIFSFYPYFENTIFLIIRDHGFFFFQLLALFLFFKYLKNTKNVFYIPLILCITLFAAFFRIEAILFFLLFIFYFFVSFIKDNNVNSKKFLILFSVIFFICIIPFLDSINLLGRIGDFQVFSNIFLDKLNSGFNDKFNKIDDFFRFSYESHHISALLVLIYFFVRLFIFFGPSAFLINRDNICSILTKKEHLILFLFFLAGLLIALINLYINSFLSRRYLVFYILTLYPLIAFYIYKNTKLKKNIFNKMIFLFFLTHILYGFIRISSNFYKHEPTNAYIAYKHTFNISDDKMLIIDKVVNFYRENYSTGLNYPDSCISLQSYEKLLINEELISDFESKYYHCPLGFSDKVLSDRAIKIFNNDKGHAVYLIALNVDNENE